MCEQGGRDISVLSVIPVVNVSYSAIPTVLVSTAAGALEITLLTSSTVSKPVHAQQCVDEIMKGLRCLLADAGVTAVAS